MGTWNEIVADTENPFFTVKLNAHYMTIKTWFGAEIININQSKKYHNLNIWMPYQYRKGTKIGYD